MIVSFLFLFLMLLIITLLIFYLFCFFLPALKIKYDGISDSLSSELRFYTDTDSADLNSDITKIAFVQKLQVSSDDKRLFYKGEKNCRLFHEIYSSEYKNPKVCIGFGDCVKICPQEAIKIHDGCAVVTEMCNGCGKCIDFCPENIISLVPRTKKIEESASKGFKFWKACYRLWNRVRG